MAKTVRIKDITVGGGFPLVLIAGPCVIEGEEEALIVAQRLKEVTQKAGVPFIFKASYDKANRSSLSSYRGPGLREGLRIFRRIREEINVPILSDVHSTDEAVEAAQELDVLQIPAFLCRQTALLMAAAKTGKPINVKKGQFLSPWDMGNVVEKIASTGNEQILLTERGVSFGYNNLVTDMRSLVVMRNLSYPVVFDATHSVQLPGAAGDSSGGEREFIPYLARGAVAVGCDAVFCEVHPDPERALCDGPNSLRLEELAGFLQQIKKVDEVVRGWS